MPADTNTSCPFCDPAPHRVVRSSRTCVALRDAFPIAEGHCLVVPRRHVAGLFDLFAEEQADAWALVREIREELQRDLDPDGFTIGLNDGAAAGQTVFHAHIHVIPRRHGDVEDPRGGIRWVRPDRACYWESPP